MRSRDFVPVARPRRRCPPAGREVADEVATEIVGLEPVEEDRLARVGSRVQVTVDESRRHELARGLDPALDVSLEPAPAVDGTVRLEDDAAVRAQRTPT